MRGAGSNPTPATSVTCTPSAFARGCLSFGPMPNDISDASSPNSSILRVLPLKGCLAYQMTEGVGAVSVHDLKERGGQEGWLLW